MDILLFTKHLKTVGGLDLGVAAARAAGWGFDGLDLTALSHLEEAGFSGPLSLHAEYDVLARIESGGER